MKKYWIIGLSLVVMLAVAVSFALAQGVPDTGTPDSDTAVLDTPAGSNFVDADADGICDNCDAVGMSMMNGNRHGAAADAATSGNAGSNFVDEDGDGVCDTCGAATGQALGQGNRHGHNGAGGPNGMHGQRRGPNNLAGAGMFVDEDGDGVCDNCQGQGPQNGTANGNGYGRMNGRWSNAQP